MAFRPGLRAVRQLLRQQAALREGHDAVWQARAVGPLAERSQPVQQLARARHGPDQPARRGGSMYLGEAATRSWGSSVQTSFSASYNNKGGNDEDTYNDFPGFGPSHQRAPEHLHLRRRAHRQRHAGDDEQHRDAEHRAVEHVDGARRPHLLQDRLDRLARAEDRRLGGAELVAATSRAAPSTRASTSKRVVQIDPNNPAAGTVAVPRAARHAGRVPDDGGARPRLSASTCRTGGSRSTALTLNMGVRVDFVRRFDDIFGVERMNSLNIGPRFGVAFLVTEDARNVRARVLSAASTNRSTAATRSPPSDRPRTASARPLRRQRRRHLRERDHHAGGHRGDQRARVRSQTCISRSWTNT